MEVGISLKSTLKVSDTDTARVIGSGTLNVLATPAVITLIEKTAWKSVEEYIGNDKCTVGTEINIKHLAPSPVGMTVICKTTLTGINGRKLVFQAVVCDKNGVVVAKGTHIRFIVDSGKFQKKADEMT